MLGFQALNRRRFLRGIGIMPVALVGCASQRGATSAVSTPRASNALSGSASQTDFAAECARIERELGGRLGVAAFDTATDARARYRSEERFAMCSTFKLVLVGAVLARVDAKQEQLERRIAYGAANLLEYAPVTRQHVADGGMTVQALCEAAITVSDNTAANLLLETLGGPPGLTAYFRLLGDATSRLDRNEPMLNTAFLGDDRDTTTPTAMLASASQLLLGNALAPASRTRLSDWLVATQTGLGRLRAGLPASFRAGDKTGTGERGATCDVAITWPSARAPLLIAAYAMGSSAPQEQLNAGLAEVARTVVRALRLA